MGRFTLAGLLVLSLAGLACSSKSSSQNASETSKDPIPASGVRLEMPRQTGKPGGRREPGACVVDGDCEAGLRCVAGRCTIAPPAPREPSGSH